MARANNFRSRKKLYKNPFSGGERSLARLLHIFFQFYIFGRSRRIVRMAKATGFKFGTLIDQVSTN